MIIMINGINYKKVLCLYLCLWIHLDMRRMMKRKEARIRDKMLDYLILRIME
jgi:hypothetical protein